MMGKYLKTRHPGIFKYVGRKGEVYGIDYYSGGKKHREIVGPLLEEAQKKLAERRQKKGNVISLADMRRKAFADLAKEYRGNFEGDSYFQKTRKYYVSLLENHFGPMKLREIGTLAIDQFKTERKNTITKDKKERSGTSVNREMETLSHMFNKAVEWGWMETNPFDRFQDSPFFPESSRIRYLEPDEMKKLLEALDTKPEGKKRRKSPEYLKAIIKAAILTGIRKSDLLNLKWSDYKQESGRLYFYEKKKRKMSDKILGDDMIALLESLPRGESEYIFARPNGKELKSVTRAFRTALKRAGIANFRFHDLRHTSASYLMMRGASLKAVQQQLGHTTLKMTEKYAHLSDEFQREEINRLNGLLPIASPISKKLVRNWEKESLPISEEAFNA